VRSVLFALTALVDSNHAFHARGDARNGMQVAQPEGIDQNEFPLQKRQADEDSLFIEESVSLLPSIHDPVAKDEGCPGGQEYKQWIDKLFDLAPPPPSCAMAKSFITSLKETTIFSANLWVLRKRGNVSHIFNARDPSMEPRGRARDLQYLWESAVKRRHIHDGAELLVYIGDKPRNVSRGRPHGVSHPGDTSVPFFSFATEFPAGSGMPTTWKGHVPFPSPSFLNKKVAKVLDEGSFLARRPVVFYRGRLSENCWGRFKVGQQECNTTVRSKLALATSDPADKDVLDVRITGPAVKTHQYEIKAYFKRKYNYNLSLWKDTVTSGNSRMVLAAPGNGWAGDTMMKGMLEGPVLMYLVDRSHDDEGITKDLGEIYFPFMKPGTDYVPVDYGSIATEARGLNANPTTFALYRARELFAKRFLGIGCALTTIELLSNRYHEYMSRGCSPSDQYEPYMSRGHHEHMSST